MGRWDRRWIPRRRYNSKKYRDYDYEEPPPSPPSPHHPQSNPPPIRENGGSSWEIDFCKSVRVSWKKVLAAKNFMYCYGNVVEWDDSAAEEAFHDAKRRYWEKVNCLSCETPLPNKDMYLDKIDWNPYIDPKLISDLDQEYFNPDEVAQGDTLWTRVKKHNDAVPVNNENPDELPWENDAARGVRALNDAIPSWSQNTKSINSEDVNNPWEQSCTQVDKSLKINAWKGSADKGPTREAGICWVQTAKSIDAKDVNNPWEQSDQQFDESLRNNACKGWDQNSKSINSKDVNNAWEQSLCKSDKSLTTNAWKGFSGVDPQGIRTHCDLKAKSTNLKEVSNPWEQNHICSDDSLKNNAWKGFAGECLSQRGGTRGGKYRDPINPKDLNRWERSCTPIVESLCNNTWKGCPEESLQKESTYNRWSAENAGDKRWARADDRCRGWKQWNISSREQQYPANTENTWQRNLPSHARVSWGSRGWTEHVHNSRGWKQPEIQNKRPKNVNYKGPFGGGGVEHSGYRKREGSLQHSPRYKTTRIRGDEYMTAQR